HLLDIKTWLEDVRQLSKPGTLWVVEVPFELIYVRGLMRRAPLQRPTIHDQHLNFFTPESLAYVGRMAGLHAISVEIVVTPYWFGPTVSLRLHAVEGAAGTDARAEGRLRTQLG